MRITGEAPTNTAQHRPPQCRGRPQYLAPPETVPPPHSTKFRSRTGESETTVGALREGTAGRAVPHHCPSLVEDRHGRSGTRWDQAKQSYSHCPSRVKKYPSLPLFRPLY